MYMAGWLPIDKLIARTYTLGEINGALEATEKRDVIRSVIMM
jgi:Zn-dependent alcohol dehydrogenase